MIKPATTHSGSGMSGFTFIEIVIVLALLGILASVALTKYYDIQEEAQKKSCAYTRAALANDVRLLRLRYPNGEDAVLLTQVLAENEQIKCPLDGSYSITENKTAGLFLVNCSIHGSTVDIGGGPSHRFDNADDIKTIMGIMDKETVGNTDSEAGIVNASSHCAEIVKQLAEQGLNLAEMGAVSWNYNKKDGLFYWTGVKISDLPTNSTTPVLRYNSKTGTFTVWFATIEERTLEGSATPYKIINGFSPYRDSTNSPKDDQTYANALALFAKASGK